MAIATATPGSAVDPNPINRFGLLSLFAKGIVGPAIGIACGVPEMTIEEFEVRRM